jgi:hypothetical protein
MTTDNGENQYGVSFGRIMFLQQIIAGHDNILSFSRHSDIAFDVTRELPRDVLQIICVDEYALAEAKARSIVADFPNAHLIFVGGKWNKTTVEASSYCRAKKIGICNAGNINAALSKSSYWL